ncbi:hypothetical protein ACK1O1_02890 [Stenotrophomonas maltophilia]|jgi:hypothetical protein|uniref:hypothetical protein n=1 Tax=Stenotrophomonas TaxID=40323 RepID=UPI00201CC1E2|nr:MULTISPECIES: hypothetical protein [Stenotrophomonas]MBN5025756.1 hypothetical protein [Stenotrophomonas maltophilia]MDH1273016.1 hypothetical protein [Stenotrophomonas sp. GD03937]MDH1484396.1 hypothetical protein [Stenotrophomonas sp. GD03712]UQY93995.1 hypothetical protein LZ605_12625 [Stenotrophomonas maltophilia]WON69326.1 hypothetical protein RWT08_02965 [Stenotrophomonas maltophilia]
MDESGHKRMVAVGGLLLGLPALAAAGTVAVLGLMVVADGKYLSGNELTVLLLWSSGGVIGLLSWLWLSGVFLRRGRAGLRQSSPAAWVGLGLGVLAALAVVAVTLHLVFKQGEFALLSYLGLGPPFLLPAAHLAWLRWGATDTV